MAPPPLFLAAVFCASVAVAARCDDLKPKFDAQVAPGIQLKVLADDLRNPRGMTADFRGNLLVVERGGGGIRRIVLDDGGGLDACVLSSSQLVVGDGLNHGIALSADGNILFASSPTDVYAYEYDDEKGTVGTAKKIITGMAQSGHSTRTLLVPRHAPNLLLVSRGSNGNIDNATADVGSARSQIRIFDIDELLGNSEAVQYSHGEVLGWGLRNSVGMGEHPATGHIWSVDNSIDVMTRGGVDVHNTNPGDELNFHGLVNDTRFRGKNYGYPACVAIANASAIAGYPGGARRGLQMVGDQMPSNYTDEWCESETLAPIITFGAHLAPLDIKFTPDARFALISFHGSWNRKPPNGYRVSRVAFKEGFPEADGQSDTAEEQLLWNKNNTLCPDQCFRPVGLVLDEEGKRLFVTSDTTGELFVVTGAAL